MESRELFKEINTYLEGEKHYTKEEIMENEDNFVLAIDNKDIEYLQGYYNIIEERHINKIEELLSM